MANILVVDDEKLVRNFLRRLLEKNRFEYTLAANASEARNCMKDRIFDLLLCDIMMPGESGIDFIRYVKADFPNTAIIMLTAVDDQDTAKVALRIGVYGYIIKPFDENQILINVANALRRRALEMKEMSYRKDLERVVRERTAELEIQTKELQEVNSALRVLLKKREADRTSLEENVLSNMKIVAEPYLEKLKQSGLNDIQRTYLNILESNLNDISSPLVRELSSEYLDLTPSEIHVAHLIKEGKRTKEIASILCLSYNTIISHRYKIRSKLGLKNKKINLRTFLQTLR